ncbi:ribonuclease P protein component [Actinomyces sp. MRS3W]|uniref:ribonuclease P protein component n=1 Tax=Actinomyces sp. MRS3W TaxID=2800796 RepID=UPI0028FD74F4|nr:ribonuclease P protein component [Actinomyces sp. MRS3W]MDU0347977.1 ribonuclease P protein component [Actinomyces sp. MRS3W]
MLPAAHRMLRSDDFSTAVKSGARSGSRRLVVHYCVDAAQPTAPGPALVGIVVPKRQVARATHRNRIKRRLRALMRARLDSLEPGARVVVRGLAGADGASSTELAADLDRLLARSRSLAHARQTR